MARIQGQEATAKEPDTPQDGSGATDEGEGLESGTPTDVQAVSGALFPNTGKSGLRLAAPRRNIVDDYPERTYEDARAK